MGLDMYLEARKYVAKVNWEETRKTPEAPYVLTEEYKSLIKHAPEGIDEFADVSGINISFPIGYWRKANAIHGWFIENCADGKDDCQPFRVGLGSLLELSAIVDEVLTDPANRAMELLPPVEGFFFGSYEVDEWYLKELEITKSILDKAKVLADSEDYDIYYQASW